MGEIKTIGVLTSGGDAPGMNAAIRAIVRTAIASGLNVKGIMRGYAGLLNEEIIDMDKQSVSEIMRRGAALKNHIFCQAFHLHMMFHVSILFRIIFTQPLLTQHRLL